MSLIPSKFLIVFVVSLGLMASAHIWAEESPYRGQEARDIKALSAQQIEGYLQGAGMGLAKSAELNSYPGPLHVLQLADQLELTDEQKTKTQALMAEVKAEAQALGRQLVDKEAELDLAFAQQTIDAETLEQHLAEIGVLQAKLRGAHLAAHLKQRALMSATQVKRYDQLRGYGHGSDGQNHGHRHGQHDGQRGHHGHH